VVNYQPSLGINGTGTAYRIMNDDADLVSIDDVINIDGTDYTVREKEKNDRTTVLTLEH